MPTITPVSVKPSPVVVDSALPSDPALRAAVGDLLARAGDGDPAAWNAIVDRYTNLLWSVARSHRLGGADAADVVQTTWLRLVESISKIRDPEGLPGWLVTTARRECLRVLRRSRREVAGRGEDALDLPDEGAPELDAALLTDERDAVLWQCFARLPDRCQQLLRVLMATEPTAYASVSAALGMPVGSIGPTRMRSLDRLRQLMIESGYPFDPISPEK